MAARGVRSHGLLFSGNWEGRVAVSCPRASVGSPRVIVLHSGTDSHTRGPSVSAIHAGLHGRIGVPRSPNGFTGQSVFMPCTRAWSRSCAAVTSILFGLWHGLDINARFTISIDVAPMIIPTVGGFVLAWCRARSGSLLLPVLAHAGMNETANLLALMKAK